MALEVHGVHGHIIPIGYCRHILLDNLPLSPYRARTMSATLIYDPQTHQATGPAGALPIAAADRQATRFLMLLEGQCLQTNIATVAARYGYSRPRYYQLLDQYTAGGLAALEPRKSGPKSNYRRTEQVVRQVLRYRFLDPDAAPEVIAQKLRQRQVPISNRSVSRILADYGVQKKTLHAQPPKPAAAGAHAAGRGALAPGARRRPEPGTGRAPTPGR